MFHAINRRLRRLALTALLGTTATLGTLSVSRAGDFDCESSIVAVRGLISTETSPVQPPVLSSRPTKLAETEELCGWVEPDQDLPLPDSAIVATTVAATRIQVKQVVEPFALVGPYLENSLDTVRNLQAWYDKLVDIAESQRQVDEAKLQSEIEAIALQEPIDIESFGPSVLVHTDVEPAIQIERLDPLVGGSAIVATIAEEDYMAYDWSSRDLKLWSVLPTSPQPFCIRDSADQLADALMRDEAEAAQEQSLAATVKTSPDCLLDETILTIESMLASQAFDRWTHPSSMGEAIADWSQAAGRATNRAMNSIATKMPAVAVDQRIAVPKADAESPPSEAGSKLLARAGAETGLEPQVATMRDTCTRR